MTKDFFFAFIEALYDLEYYNSINLSNTVRKAYVCASEKTACSPKISICEAIARDMYYADEDNRDIVVWNDYIPVNILTGEKYM